MGVRFVDAERAALGSVPMHVRLQPLGKSWRVGRNFRDFGGAGAASAASAITELKDVSSRHRCLPVSTLARVLLFRSPEVLHGS